LIFSRSSGYKNPRALLFNADGFFIEADVKTILFIFSILLLLLPGRSCADDAAARYYDLREMEIRQFAADLFIAGEYFRAITEAKRYISLFPEGPRTEEMFKRIGDACLMSHEWGEAIASYDHFLMKFPASPQAGSVTFFKAIALLKQGKAAEAERLFQLVLKGADPRKKGEAARWEILLLIRGNRFDEAERRMMDQMVKPEIEKEADIITEMITEKKNTRYKSPETAGVLSAVLPGSGQFYNERYQDGVYSFLLNSLFILGAYKAYDQGNYALGGLLTLFEIGWYTGGIYGAVGGAHKYNTKIDEDLFRRGVERMNLLESEIGRPGGVSVRFTYPF
jgi:tetratricopeptide (TPR) repeat protein